jgi:hypothetical protein
MPVSTALKRISRLWALRPYPPWRQVARPFSLGLVGLAAAVVVLGFGYKLSLYHRYRPPSLRASVTKMWIEPRNTSVAAASRLKTESHLVPGAQALLAPAQQFPHAGCVAAPIFPVRTRGVTYCNFLIPSRSPPPYRFRLA